MPATPVTWAELNLTPDRAGDQRAPQTTQLANGNILVLWQGDAQAGEPAGPNIYSRLFTPDLRPIGGTTRLNTAAPEAQDIDPSVVALPDGGFLFVYKVVAGNNNALLIAERYNAAQQFVASNLVSGGTVDVLKDPQVTVGTGGTVLISYIGPADSGGRTIFTQTYNLANDQVSAPDGQFDGQNIVSIDSYDIAAVTGGGFAVAFNGRLVGDGSPLIYTARLSSAGASLSNASAVANSNGANFAPSVVATSNGHLVAFNRAGAAIEIEARDANNQSAGAVDTVATFGALLGTPALERLADNSYVLAFPVISGAVTGLYTTRYDSSFQRISNGAIYQAGSFEAVELKLLSDGRFVSVAHAAASGGTDILLEVLDTRDTPNAPVGPVPFTYQVGTPGADTFTASTSDYFVYAGPGNDDVTVPLGAQSFAGPGDDIVRVTSTVDGGNLVESNDGGEGTDTIDWSQVAQSNLVFNLAAGTVAGGAITDAMTGFENVIGTINNDTFLTAAGANRFEGRGGDDTYRVDGADNVIEATNGGADSLFTATSFVLGAGSEVELLTVDGAAVNVGVDLTGNEFAQTISGHDGPNTLFGRGGSDLIFGNGGDDVLIGGAGADEMDGGAGIDTASYRESGAPITINFVTGARTGEAIGDSYFSIERFELSSLFDTFVGTASEDEVYGLGGGDNLSGGDGADFLDGGAGDDMIDGGAGGDFMVGGAGGDTYRVDSAGDIVLESAGGGNDHILTTVSYSIAFGVEVERLSAADQADVTPISLTGNGFNNILTGNAGANRLDGGPGNDTVFGLDGNDLLFSGSGSDNLEGGGGDDGFIFGPHFDGTDRVIGGAGTFDQVGLQGTYNNLALPGANFSGVEFLVLLSGADTRFGAPGTARHSYNITTAEANVAAGERLVVTFNSLLANENVTFNGAAETNGTFLTFAGQGVDVLTGGQQDDGFFFGGGQRFGPGDRMDGQGGAFDTFGLQGDYSGANKLVLAPTTLANVEILALLSATDTRFGSGSALPFSYDVTLNDGNVAAGQRLIVSANMLTANGAFNETLRLDGSAELDGRLTVFAGNGEDVIIGGRGADELFGRGGNDRFVYTDARQSTDAARDQIKDFNAGDKIDLSALDANSNAAGGQPFSFVGASAFTGAGQLRMTGGAGSWLVEGETNGDGIADFVLAVTTVDPNYQLGGGDFLFT